MSAADQFVRLYSGKVEQIDRLAGELTHAERERDKADAVLHEAQARVTMAREQWHVARHDLAAIMAHEARRYGIGPEHVFTPRGGVPDVG